MPNPMKRVHDLLTNEITDTEMTDAEYATFLDYEKNLLEQSTQLGGN
jgi:hypothetical protein